MFGPGRRSGRRAGRRAARRVSRRQAMMRDAMTPQAPPPAQESAPPIQEPVSTEAEPDYVAEIERLGQLKEKGLITEEEFEAKKKQLLGL